jgi:hypothetical protein
VERACPDLSGGLGGEVFAERSAVLFTVAQLAAKSHTKKKKIIVFINIFFKSPPPPEGGVRKRVNTYFFSFFIVHCSLPLFPLRGLGGFFIALVSPSGVRGLFSLPLFPLQGLGGFFKKPLCNPWCFIFDTP